MASAKQIKARKLFAKRVKRGDFRKAISKTKKAKSKGRIFPNMPVPKARTYSVHWRPNNLSQWTDDGNFYSRSQAKKVFAEKKKLGYEVKAFPTGSARRLKW